MGLLQRRVVQSSRGRDPAHAGPPARLASAAPADTFVEAAIFQLEDCGPESDQASLDAESFTDEGTPVDTPKHSPASPRRALPIPKHLRHTFSERPRAGGPRCTSPRALAAETLGELAPRHRCPESRHLDGCILAAWTAFGTARRAHGHCLARARGAEPARSGD